MRCDQCKYFIPYSGEPSGECRKLPPKPISRSQTLFPVVSQSWWCGEFAQKEIEQPKVSAKKR